MKTLKTKFVLFTLLISLFVSCSKDDDFDVQINNQAEITSFKINNIDGDIVGSNIALVLPSGTDITKLVAETTLSTNATISPNPATVIDYSLPKQFIVTAEDGVTTKTYTVTITVSTTQPTAENPYSEGVFILRWLQGTNYELDFRHTSGTVTTKVFQKANNGQIINDFSITDIIPHNKGYVVFSNLLNGTGAKVYFTDLKLKIKHEQNIEKANILARRYAQINNKVYYTNVSDKFEVNQPNNKTYIIDTEAETLTSVASQYLQFFVDTNSQLYALDVAEGLQRITDLNTLNGTLLTNFEQNATSYILDANNRLWSTRKSRHPNSLFQVTSYRAGLFNYKLNLECYDLNTNTKVEGVSIKDINRDSRLFTKHNKVYVITNQNTHIPNAKKELQELYVDSNEAKLRVAHELPKIQSTQQGVVDDIEGLDFIGSTMVVFGNNNDVPASNGSRTYYYDLDVSNGTVTNKTLGATNIFERKSRQ